MYIDIFLGIFVLIGLIQGFSRGIIRTLFSIAGVIIALIVSMKLSPLVVSLFDNVFNWDPLITLILGVALTFVLILWLVRWIGKRIEGLLKVVKLNIFNKLAGAILFGCLMIALYGTIIGFLDRADALSKAQRDKSISYPYLLEVPEKTKEAFEFAKPLFKSFWNKVDEVVNVKKDE